MRSFVEKSFEVLNIKIGWKGTGLNEVGYNLKNNQILLVDIFETLILSLFAFLLFSLNFDFLELATLDFLLILDF